MLYTNAHICISFSTLYLHPLFHVLIAVQFVKASTIKA